MPYLKVQNFKNSGRHKKFLFNPITARGFSLVELLVVLAIMGILATIGLARYNNFNARQQVKNAALELKSELRKYQTLAISGQKNPNPSDPTCNNPSNTLNSYFIEITTGPPPTFLARIDCPGPPSVIITNNFTWPVDSGIQVADVGSNTVPGCGAIQIRFRPLNQGVGLYCAGTSVDTFPGSDRVYVDITNSSNIHYRVFVTYSGNIYEEKQP